MSWHSPIRAGDLRDVVKVRREVIAKNNAGGIDRSWETVADRLPANVTSLNGREAMIDQALQGISAFQIVVRYREDIQVSDQLIWKGRELNIHSAEDRDGRRTWTYIQASTDTPQGAQ